VVIIAPEPDLHAQVVAKRVEELGGHAVILDSALFPTRWNLTVRISSDGYEEAVLEHDDLRLADQDIVGVWWRRPCWYRAAPEVAEANLRRFIALEAKQALEGWLHGLGSKVINPLAADTSAGYKLLQLQRAAEVGLKVPRTVATNSPRAAGEFTNTQAAVVYKPFTGADWQFIGTQRMTEDAKCHLDCVAHSPVLFQEEIAKSLDVRANIIDDTVYAIGVRSKHQRPPVDWRLDPDPEYTEHQLPPDIEQALILLMRNLGLRFGACDLAITDSGDYVFFEVNPGGQWLVAEIMTGQNLSHAFALALLEPPNYRPAVRRSSSTSRILVGGGMAS
jgi:glutathione synthase/RimK-type ligase-like ATP-grasp enzyme